MMAESGIKVAAKKYGDKGWRGEPAATVWVEPRVTNPAWLWVCVNVDKSVVTLTLNKAEARNIARALLELADAKPKAGKKVRK